jgi:hypothetical protein
MCRRKCINYYEDLFIGMHLILHDRLALCYIGRLYPGYQSGQGDGQTSIPSI